MDINRVILKWNTNAAKTFKIQTSTDATTWTDVFSTTLGASYTVTDEKFPTTTARYVRMNATERAPLPFGGRGGRGRGRGGPAGTPPVASTSTTPAAVAPSTQAAYSLFDFMVLKD
jgi:beta-glucosidase